MTAGSSTERLIFRSLAPLRRLIETDSVTEVLVNGAPKEKRLEYHDMNGLFNEVEAFQDKDAKEKRKVFCQGVFASDTGAILRFVRSVPNSREWQQIKVEVLEAK